MVKVDSKSYLSDFSTVGYNLLKVSSDEHLKVAVMLKICFFSKTLFSLSGVRCPKGVNKPPPQCFKYCDYESF